MPTRTPMPARYLRQSQGGALAFLSLGAAAGMWTRIGLSTGIDELGTHMGFISAPRFAGLPVALIVANFAGTFLLLLLTLRWQTRPPALMWRYMWAGGFCGALTSYSAMVVAYSPGLESVPLVPFASWEVVFAWTAVGIIGALGRWWISGRVSHVLVCALRDPRQAQGWPIRWLRLLLPAQLRSSEDISGMFSSAFGTAVVNLLAAALAGALCVVSVQYVQVGALMSGAFLGCFSTFSTAIIDVWQLWRHECVRAAIVVLVGVFVCAVALCASSAFVMGLMWGV